MIFQNFWPRWRQREICFASSHNQRRTTANLKTKCNQNCQKIELYGSPTTKELKRKHLSRLVGGVETGSWVERTQGKAVAGGLVVKHLCADKPGGTPRERDRLKPRVPVQENKASNPLTIKICEGCDGGRNSQPHRRVCWRDQKGPTTHTNPPTWNQHRKSPICL